MFFFGTLSFGGGIDMDIVRTLIAFAVLEDLKTVNMPKHGSYAQFHYKQSPQLGYILQLMRPACVPYGSDERIAYRLSLTYKSRKKLEAAEVAHEQKVATDCQALAQFFLK